MRGWVFGVIAAVAFVVVIGVGVIVAITSGDDTAIVDLEVGDCFDLPDEAAGGEIRSVPLVDCAQPHLAEVVATGELNADDDPYPDDEELFARVDEACRAAEVVESDAFGLLPIAPTRELWESFDGRFLCVAIPFGGDPVTGSIAAG
jgi:hypothetical protein